MSWLILISTPQATYLIALMLIFLGLIDGVGSLKIGRITRFNLEKMLLIVSCWMQRRYPRFGPKWFHEKLTSLSGGNISEGYQPGLTLTIMVFIFLLKCVRGPTCEQIRGESFFAMLYCYSVIGVLIRLVWWDSKLATIDSLNSLIKSATRPSRTLKEVTRMEAIIYKFMCVLWSYRNYYIFSGKIKCTTQLVVKVKFISFLWCTVRGKRISHGHPY